MDRLCEFVPFPRSPCVDCERVLQRTKIKNVSLASRGADGTRRSRRGRDREKERGASDGASESRVIGVANEERDDDGAVVSVKWGKLQNNETPW